MSANSQFKIDSITVDGVSFAIVDSSVTVSGLKDSEATVVPSASGPDFESHARVPRQIRGGIQFGPNVDIAGVANIQGARVVLKDSRGPRRILATNCSMASIGEAGNGPLAFVMNALEPYQYL